MFTNYLANRTQCVKIGCSRSNSLKVSCGVPQESALGPILFILYINGLPELIVQQSVINGRRPSNVHLYADDQQPCTKAQCKVSELHISSCQMKSELTLINTWLITNKLKPNINKYQFLIIGTSKQLLKINDRHIEL